MSAANKRKGSAWERDLEDYLNEQGLEARRLPRAGNKDIGDVAIHATLGVVVTKTRQAGPGDGRVVMSVDTFIDLLRWAGIG